ncbi:protein FAM83A isoform X1 [Danio aesculapii]|uniref:protein FAM83A isoform X1 n=1 Tax=Danio aesculapii TaxID=1142201 RepID=UPI0024BFC690|nr:protein FAM83A isoform X1 [Danio aesculapii]
MNLVSNGLSVQCYLKPKMMGKMRKRVQEMRNPKAVVSSFDLSHNESTRLAMDALLDKGIDGYQKVLRKENEANFLSAEEKAYILNHVKKPPTHEEEADGDEEMSSSPSVSSETYFPVATESEPPVLDYGWPVADWTYHLQGIPSVEVFFQSAKSSSMKDVLRELIRQATKVLAIVMDTFSDVEIFCDILEATRKRSVYVYLLLDHTNLQLFQDMCENVKMNKSHLSRVSIRSVQGETYCAKSGRKFTGQVKEKFIIVDCTKVLVGSYSLTWLSWQVHRSLAVLFKGSAVKPFDQEFRRLYAISKPVPGFSSNASNPGDLYFPFEKLQIPMCPTGLAGNTADHTQQKSCKPRTQSFPTPPVLARQSSYPSFTTGQQSAQWLSRRNTIHHPVTSQSPLFKDYNARSQTWRPIQGIYINRGAPAAPHWC